MPDTTSMPRDPLIENHPDLLSFASAFGCVAIDLKYAARRAMEAWENASGAAGLRAMGVVGRAAIEAEGYRVAIRDARRIVADLTKLIADMEAQIKEPA